MTNFEGLTIHYTEYFWIILWISVSCTIWNINFNRPKIFIKCLNKKKIKNWAICDIFVFYSNEDREKDILLVLVLPGSLEWQQISGGDSWYHMFTLQGLDISKTLLILSKYTKHVAVRKWNVLIKVDFLGARRSKENLTYDDKFVQDLPRTFCLWTVTFLFKNSYVFVYELLRFCAWLSRRLMYILLLELLIRSFTGFSGSYIVENS